ncbi:hypothetical protein FGL01_18770 [Flavobacterium glycines]|uniref:DUF4890 domain-containing protein n=2 Tax=Flavobacterium glycines TaxID=551990 RepID=A0A511CL89_9FLAO|nr:hypothetical protein FGL01_18770 [Flavobacterium glycines]
MMKKTILLFILMLISNLSFGQNKPKNMKAQRDSIFTVMKLSDENKLKMHELIAKNGNGQKAIKEDPTLSEEQKKEKLQAWKKDITAEERKILTTEQFEIWRDFGKSSKQK